MFWFDKKDEEKILEKVRIDFRLPNNYDFSKSQYRYYTAEKVVKLFDSGQERKGNEEIFKAINQCLHGMVYYRPKVSLTPTNNKYICFPIIVVNSFEKFYRVDPPSKDYTKITEPFLDENRRSVNEYFLIDVVEYGKFGNFLEEDIKNDINHLLSDYHYNQIF